MIEWKREIAQLYNFPSIVVWTPFNEGWGQHDTEQIASLTKQLDPSRLVNAASGGYNQIVDGKMSQYRLPTPPGIGDINDTHTYPEPSVEKADATRALVTGEFGGISMRVPDHLWSAANFGYGAIVANGWHLTRRYQELLKMAYRLRDEAGASAVVYTQIADVEDETNGMLTYDRAVLKPLADVVASANRGVFLPLPPNPEVPVVPTAEGGPVSWSYTFGKPADDWMQPAFDASTWRVAAAPFGQGLPQMRTAWSTPDIWMRREFALLESLPSQLAFSVEHDEDAEIYLNGVLAARLQGFNNGYDIVPMNEAGRAALKPGHNTLAVHVHQTIGGQGIDVGIIGFAAAVSSTARPTAIRQKPFAMGADLSLLQHLQDHGVQFKEAGAVKDPLLIFKDHGCNFVRLRLFVAPDGTQGQVNTLPYTLKMARRVKAAGLPLLLDFHYSDGWADPQHQIIPAEWKELSHPQLVERIFSYTRETLDAFRREGCAPEMVQVGNEIRNGLMWPDGGPLDSDAKWDALADLVKSGIRGVKASDPQHTIKIMIHNDQGGNAAECRRFFDNLQRRGVEFDVVGLSYYPFWHGTLADLKANLASLAYAFKRDIMVAETGYDMGGNQNTPPFPITPEGQKAFLEELIRTVAATPGGHGAGVFYWAPEWIEGKQWDGPEWSSIWENRALFNSRGEMLPALQAFKPGL